MLLGTCNFGQNYNGVELSKDYSLKMIDYFYSNGGRIIDTAFNYASQPIIKEWLRHNKGNELKIITKIWKQDEFWQCLDELGVNKLYCVMARENNIDMIEYLRDQKDNGMIEKFGLSCYLTTEMTRSYFQCLEIPLSPCWLSDELDIMSLYSNIYFRSVFNVFMKQYGEDETFKLVNELKKNPKIDFVVGCDSIKQLRNNMELFK